MIGIPFMNRYLRHLILISGCKLRLMSRVRSLCLANAVSLSHKSCIPRTCVRQDIELSHTFPTQINVVILFIKVIQNLILA